MNIIKKIKMKEEIKGFCIIWLSSFLLVWLFTRNFRLGFGVTLFLMALAISKNIAREILTVSALTIVPLAMIFSGMDVVTATAICITVALIASAFVYVRLLPTYISASLYVPAIAISIVIAETL